MSRASEKSDWLDGAAELLSGLCLLHCLALPLFVAGLPLLSQFGDGHLHLEVLIVIVPLSIVALSLGYRRHGIMNVIWIGVGGLAILFFGATVVHDNFGEMADRVVTVTGSIVLAVAHYLNSTRRPIPLAHGQDD